jgi:uncharacterized protein
MPAGRTYDGFVPGRHVLESYGAGGFRFAEMSHRGSILALPSGIKAWPVTSAKELCEEAFAPVFAEAEAIDLLLLGTGREPGVLHEFLRWRFADAKIGVEAMQTGAAARTYNILLAENRKVAAALIAVA